MSSRKEYSGKILKKLAEKRVVSIESIAEKTDKKTRYAINRSIKNLATAGCVEIIKSDNKSYLRLTKAGKEKLDRIKLEGEGALVSPAWDGFWRIVILDMPEERKNEREALRYLLKKAGFRCVKNTVWISPYPYEFLFENIKKDMGLLSELMIIVSNKIDEKTRHAFLKSANG